jgi:hypothetical protein
MTSGHIILSLDVATSISGLVTAIAALVAAFGALVAAFGGLLVSIKLLRTTADTHKLVNQQRTDLEAYNRALIRALKLAGIEIPIDQSLPPE